MKGGGGESFYKHPRHMTKIAAIPIYGKNFQRSSEPKVRCFSGLPRSGKKVWKMIFSPGQGKVREFQF